jgi:hypothetical protein
MSNGIRQRKKVSAYKNLNRKQELSPYTDKIVKVPTKQRIETELRHAVKNNDTEAFEDYDEWKRQ